MQRTKKAVVLLSGGLDSSTVLAIAAGKGYECYALSIDYAQRHSVELAAASRVAKAVGAKEHRTITIDPKPFSGSALTETHVQVPKDRSESEIAEGVPPTYVPARNTVFLSYALAWAESLGAFDIFIGVNCLDYSGYPDCRPEFIEAFEKLANLATAAATQGQGYYKIHSPLITMTKAQIIALGTKLGFDYALTHSCYDPDANGRPCGQCDSCKLRRKGFADAGLKDPLDYSN